MMDFNLVRVRLWLDFDKAPHFEVQRLLEGKAYSDLSVESPALI